MRLLLTVSALLTLVVTTPRPAQAAFLGGSQGIVDIGVPTTTGLDLGAVTRFDFGTLMTTWNQAGSFVGAPIMLLDSTPLDLASIGSFSFGSAEFGTFAATSYRDLILSPSTRELDIAGTFAPGTRFGTGLDAAGADLAINFTWGVGQIMDVGALLDASATPAPAVPEPASAALLAMGLIGGVVVRRRRRRRSSR